MSANQAAFPVAVMARVLGVSKAGFYAWRERAQSARQVADGALLARVQDVHVASRDTYGVPRVHAALRAQGDRHGRKRIARLMRVAGLVGACNRKGGPTTTRRDKEARPAPDLVDRKVTAQAPDQLWVADITYVPTMSGFLYLAVVLDVFSRRIVGWSMQNHLRTELIVNALDMAVGQCKPTDVIHHSDQGCQGGLKGSSQHPHWEAAMAIRKRRSNRSGRKIQSSPGRHSIGSVGDAYDNAMAESFFSTMECELLSRHYFCSQAEARMAYFTYIESFCNLLRLHSGLAYRSPIDYERAFHHDQASPMISPHEQAH